MEVLPHRKVSDDVVLKGALLDRCVDIALHGKGRVEPNPYVGCVVWNPEAGKIVAEGYHSRYGGPHAEVNALSKVPDNRDEELVVVVNLEPCCVRGKTPPCTEVLLSRPVKKVIAGMIDPNPSVNGKSLEILGKAGIEVDVVEHGPSLFLNRRFIKFWKEKRPYVILKWAQGINGVMGSSCGRIKITDIEDYLVHKWRREEGAILIGGNTLYKDNPLLTTRLWYGRSPVPCVITSRPPESKPALMVHHEKILIVTNSHEAYQKWREYGCLVHLAKNPPFCRGFIEEALSFLWDNGILSVIVEGGPTTIKSFISTGLWDEYRCIIKHSFVEGDIMAPALPLPPSLTVNHEQFTLLVGFSQKYPCYSLSLL